MQIWVFPAVAPIEKRTYIQDKKNGVYYFYPELCEILKDKYDGQMRMLLSAGLWEKNYHNELLRRNFPLQILVDSGGFQYYGWNEMDRKRFYRSRERYYRWQIEVGDLVLGGDIPPEKSIVNNKMLEELLAVTQTNMDFQFSLDRNLSNRFINILHGTSPENLRYWVDGVKGFPGVGWAIGAKFTGVVLGATLQYLFLVENNLLKPGDILHLFAMTGFSIFIPLVWLIQHTRPDLIISVDSSSYSLIRIGQVHGPNGVIDFKDIRSGRVKLRSYDGVDIVDIPRNTDETIGKRLELTGLQNFMQKIWAVRDDLLENNFSKYEKILVSSGIKKYYRIWQTGGIDMLWNQFRHRVIEHGKAIEK